MTNTELETAYLTLCANVERDAKRIVGKCGAGHTDAAGVAAVMLADYAATAAAQFRMQQEQTQGYDLAALRVDLQQDSRE